MVYHKVKWGGAISDWNYEVQRLRTFATDRYNFMPGHIKDFFKLTQSLATVCVSTNIPNTGSILLNDIRFSKSDTMELFRNMPYTLQAIPADGYQFKQWKIKTQNSSTETLITRGDAWKYNDSGQNLNTDWITESYNDGSWLSGPAQLGYGEGDEKTTVSYGPDAANKYITTYFRKNISITDTVDCKKAVITLLCDDGAVIYINGAEAARYNMPTSTITYKTVASSASVENIYVTYSINPKLFKPGNNTIALEMHQNSVSSSDLSFDMDLTLTKIKPGSGSTASSINITDTIKSDLFFVAEFEAKTPVFPIYLSMK